MTTFTSRQRLAAWSVHLLTATGLPLAFLAYRALEVDQAPVFFTALWVATFVDSIDGTFARRFKVKEVLPNFDGSLLDNLVDYLNFAFLPAIALPALGLLPEPMAWLAALPILASGYGFCQGNAKTEESFVGFPSYWNVLVIYLYVFEASPTTVAAFLLALSVMVFVPIHYLYPSRTRFLRRITLPVTVTWSFAILPLCLAPRASWTAPLATVTLVGPVYYFFASLAHHRRETQPQLSASGARPGAR